MSRPIARQVEATMLAVLMAAALISAIPGAIAIVRVWLQWSG